MHTVFNELLIAVIFVCLVEGLADIIKRGSYFSTDMLLFCALLAHTVLLAHYHTRIERRKDVYKDLITKLDGWKELAYVFTSIISFVGLILAAKFFYVSTEREKVILGISAFYWYWAAVYIGYSAGDCLVRCYVTPHLEDKKAQKAFNAVLVCDVTLVILLIIALIIASLKLFSIAVLVSVIGIYWYAGEFLLYEDSRMSESSNCSGSQC